MGFKKLFIKDESRNPTNSFKDRLCAVSISKAREIGSKVVTVSSTGNHGSATAAYASKAGMECVIFTAKQVPQTMTLLMQIYGAKVLATETAAERWVIMKKCIEEYGWYPNSGYINPPVGSNFYGIQGYKTMAYEICQALSWKAPDLVVQPTCYGDGLSGMWQGFKEMADLGFTDQLPRMVSVEKSGKNCVTCSRDMLARSARLMLEKFLRRSLGAIFPILSRLPITLACINRALTGPININNDHSDSMGARDAGWIQIYAENNQEAYDNFCMAMHIGEHPDVRLPVMACQDGFITSHAIENIELLEDQKVKEFVGAYNPEHYLLKKENPLAVGPYDIAAYYMEHKYQQAMAMKNAKQVILDVAKEFSKISGRYYGLFEEYRMDDAERALVIIGSSAGTAKAAVNELRAKGEKVGLIKLRVFRPFPMEELAAALAKVKVVAVMDKAESFSACGGPVFAETRSACYGMDTPPKMVNFVYGLGGRDVRVEDIKFVYEQLDQIKVSGDIGETYRHLGVRE